MINGKMQQIDGMRALNETLMAIKQVRKQHAVALKAGNRVEAQELFARLVSLYSSIGDKEISAVAYTSAFMAKETA